MELGGIRLWKLFSGRFPDYSILPKRRVLCLVISLWIEKGLFPVSLGCGNGKERNWNHDLLFLLNATEVICMMVCLCLEIFLFLSVKRHHEATDSSGKDLKIVTPLRYSQRIREKMCKLLDAVTDQDSSEQMIELEPNVTRFIHRQSNVIKEMTAEVEE